MDDQINDDYEVDIDGDVRESLSSNNMAVHGPAGQTTTAIARNNQANVRGTQKIHAGHGDDEKQTMDRNQPIFIGTMSSSFDSEVEGQMVESGIRRRTICGRTTTTVISTALAIIGILGLIAVFIAVGCTKRSGQMLSMDVTDYGIVFDAGSTHTAMMLYGWNGGEKVNGTGTPKQMFKCIVDGDGIASFANGDEDELSSEITECLDETKELIPASQVPMSPVFFGATAGMRLLNVEDPVTTERLMDAVDHALSTSGFRYDRSMSKILSGDVEGASSWIQTNYLGGSFLQMGSISTKSLIGALDLGGASTQFSALVPDGLSVDYVTMNLFGNIYNVSVSSFLCFGRRQAQFRHRALLVLNFTEDVFDSNVQVKDPCLPQGFETKVSIHKIFSSPCTWPEVQHFRHLIHNLDEDTTVTFVGTSSPPQCADLIRSQLNFSVCREQYNFTYCFEGHDLTAHRTSFIAISGFAEVMQLLKVAENHPEYEEVTSALKDVCDNNWTEMKDFYRPLLDHNSSVPRYIYKNRLSTVCFDATYAFEMLTTGYKFSNSTWNRLTFEDSIGGMDMGWAMGYMINETNFLPSWNDLHSKHLYFASTSRYFYALLALFAAFLIAAVALVMLRSTCGCPIMSVDDQSNESYRKLPVQVKQLPPHYGSI